LGEDLFKTWHPVQFLALLVEKQIMSDSQQGVNICDTEPEYDVELLKEFVIEAREFLDRAEQALLQLETDPDNIEAINTVFRAFHTVKGTSAFLSLQAVTDLAHKAENLLSRVRDRKIRCTGCYADLALRSVDMLKALVEGAENGLPGESMNLHPGYAELLQKLSDSEAIEGVEETPVEPAATWPQIDRRTQTEDRRAEFSIRVNTERLDRLVDIVGELVIAESMVTEDPLVRDASNADLHRKVARVDKMMRQLQDLALSLRMVPLKGTFQKMTRLVRDLSHKSGKSIELLAEDHDTEIDRNMVDVINDLLVHMVRNSADHGIEPSDERMAKGKPRAGTIRLSASQSGGSVIVEVRDDGRGLDLAKILDKAITKGIVSPGRNLTDHEVYSLIFEPGFSTADSVTDVSGRGVGMDVVKRGVESLRGRIDIESSPGQGATFSVHLPLTLAIADGMLVRVGRERYLIPTANIHISFRPAPAALSTIYGRGEMVMLRDELMPIIRLHSLFDVPDAVRDPAEGLLVVVSGKNRRYALLVDELLGQQQVVVKSLGARFAKTPGIAGGAILGDGCVGLILDTLGIVSEFVSDASRSPLP
jgi:two-component system chemotaxis sensor kinase CheA